MHTEERENEREDRAAAMEARQVRRRFKQLNEEETLVRVLGEDREEFVACTSYSHSMANTTDKSPLKRKRKLQPKNPSNTKSNAKQVILVDHGKSRSGKKKRTRFEDLYDNDDAKFSVMERAEEVLANVDDGVPSFMKCMLPSNVSNGFWMIFPKKFCNLHLPRNDATVILVDECGEEYETNYLVERHGLSGGWRAFSLAHRLLKGDILVFHLIKPCTLKVHIERVYGLDEVDAALCLMGLFSHAKTSYFDKKKRSCKRVKKSLEPLPLDMPQNNIQNSGTNTLSSSSEDLEGMRL
ncbi:hypothetical protein NMG60_11015305 [Bertholletia excelsa]